MNYLVAIVQSQWAQYLSSVIEHYLEMDCELNPIGGWPTGQYDRDVPWDLFLADRPPMRQNRYIEVGFTVLPFLSSRPSSWTAVGVLQHPASWIKEAMIACYHQGKGDCGRYLPKTAVDYAQLWVQISRKILENSDHLHRIEDLIVHPLPFLCLLDPNCVVEDHPETDHEIPPLDPRAWEVVERLASQLGYIEGGLDEVFLPPRQRAVVSHGHAAPAVLPHEVFSKELVISRYKEDLTWVVDVNIPILVYDKSGATTSAIERWWPLPNWGREAGTYLYHIVHRYDSLADVTYFTQGDPFIHSPDFLARLQHDYDKAECLTCSYSSEWPPPHIRELDVVEEVHGHTVHWGDALRMIEHATDRRPWWNPAGWERIFCTPIPEDVRFCYAAQWAVPRHYITRRPKKWWVWLLDECQKAGDIPIWSDPPLNAWMYEGLWKYILGDPDLYTHRQATSVRPQVKHGDTDSHVAPRGSLLQDDCQGRDMVKPWDHQATVVIPHLGPTEALAAVVDLWRLQTVAPYIIIVDTGSEREDRENVENLRREGVEIHYLRSHGFLNPFEAVAAACDLGQAIARTEYVIYTHADCFPMRYNLADDLLHACSAAKPVLGYQMTNRSQQEMEKYIGDDARLRPETTTDEWEWQVGHTLLITHGPTINRHRIRWAWGPGEDTGVKPGRFLDTEVYFNYELKRVGITPEFLGTEENFARNIDHNIDHVRSGASRRIYHWLGHESWQVQADEWMRMATAEAKQRAAHWRVLFNRL